MAGIDELKADLKQEFLKAEKLTGAVIKYLENELSEIENEPGSEDMVLSLLHEMHAEKELWRRSAVAVDRVDLTEEQFGAALSDMRRHIKAMTEQLLYLNLVVTDDGDVVLLNPETIEEQLPETPQQ